MLKRVLILTSCFGVALLVVSLAGVLVWKTRLDHRTFLTDGQAIRMQAAQASPRAVMWTPPRPLDDAVNSGADEFQPHISADGLSMLLVRRSESGDAEIFEARRESGVSDWPEARALIELYSSHDDLSPVFSPDQNAIYFASDRPGGWGGFDLWVSRRGDFGWLPPENLGDAVNSADDEMGPAVSPDGQRLYFASNRAKADAPGNQQVQAWPTLGKEQSLSRDFDIYVMEFGDVDVDDNASSSGAVAMHAINSSFHDAAPALSPAGDFLYFASDRPGGFGRLDVYRARLQGGEATEPQNLGQEINTAENELDPAMSADGFELILASDRINQAHTIDRPVGDFNIFRSESREVFTEIADAPPIDWASLWAIIGPSVLWLLLGLLALSVLLLSISMMRGARGQRLSLLARCLLASLIFHLGLLIMMTFWQVTSSIGEMIEQRGAVKVALISAPAAGDDLFAQVRGGLTSAGLDSGDVELSRAQAEIEQAIASGVVEMTAHAMAESRREDSMAQLDAPNEANVELQLAAAEAKSQTDPAAVDVNAMPAPQTVMAIETAPSTLAMQVDTQRDRVQDDVPRSAAELQDAVTLSPERTTAIQQANSIASSRDASDARPDINSQADKSAALLNAEPGEVVDVSAMSAPRAMQSRQPEVALQAANGVQGRREADVEQTIPSVEQLRAQPQVQQTGAKAQTLAESSGSVQGQSASPGLPRSATKPLVAVAPTTVVVQTAGESQRVVSRESSAGMGSMQGSSSRATVSAGTSSGSAASRADLPPQHVAVDGVTGLLATAVTTRDASTHPLKSTTLAVPAPAGSPVQRGAETVAVAVPGETSGDVATSVAAEVTPSVEAMASSVGQRASIRAGASSSQATSRVEIAPASTGGTDGATAQAGSTQSLTTLALSDHDSRHASISVRAPQILAASTGETALSDLALPAEASTSPTSGGEASGTMVHAASTDVRRAASGAASGASVEPRRVELTPIRAGDNGPSTDGQSLAGSMTTRDAQSDSSTIGGLHSAPVMARGGDAEIDVTALPGEIASTTANGSPTGEAGFAGVQMADVPSRRSGGTSATPQLGIVAVEVAPLASGQGASAVGSATSMIGQVGAGFESRATSDSVGSQLALQIGSAPSAALSEIALPQGDSNAIIATEIGEQGLSSRRTPVAAGGGVGTRAALGSSNAMTTEIGRVEFQPSSDQNSTSGASLAGTIAAQPSAGTDRESRELGAPMPMLAMAAPLDIKTTLEVETIPVVPPDNPYPQRSEDVRKELVKRGGGSEATEKAVELALDWLSKHQSADGRWAARDFSKSCDDQCDGRAKFDNDLAITGLSLLCFLGSDHTHVKDGPYRDQIQRALDWMLTQQKEDGDWRGGETMYSHGIATIAVCEAYAMTGDQRLAMAVKNAIDYIWAARNRSVGGWRYEPGQVGDTSVLGWQVMALMSAKRAGFFVPAEAFEMARAWLDLASTPARPGLYAYQPGQRFTPSMTAEGMFIQQLSGRDRHEDRMGQSADFLVQNLPVWRSDQNSYFWYYGTLALFQHQGEHWKQWNDALTKQLLANQRTEGHEAGSWDPTDQWAKIGGRVYQTALCTLCLEVYYRYLPMYAAVEELPEPE